MTPAAADRLPVRPGSGWPGDPADATTPVAATPADVVRLAADAGTGTAELDARVSVCRACRRLVAWREQVAATRTARFSDQRYWGRPVAGFGPPDARLVVVGLAPGAHGANRTGRVFTGDDSGRWLYRALHRAGFASQPEAVAADDGLRLLDTRIVCPVRCAPPDNAPTPAERACCRPWLVAELQRLAPTAQVLLALGGMAWTSLWTSVSDAGLGEAPRPRPRFGHGAQVQVGDRTVLGCFHVSRQNTSTGRLTEPMLDEVLAEARRLLPA